MEFFAIWNFKRCIACALGVEDTLVKQLESFIIGPVQDPAKDLREMMESVDIQAEIKDGALTSIHFP